jgi:Icc protein
MQVTRIVQITDLHVLSDDNDDICGVRPNRSLLQVIKDINTLSPAVDMVIASGDLTDAGSPAAYRCLRESLLKLRCPVYVMAGNHDDTEAMRRVLPGDNIFHQASVDCAGWKLLLIDSKTPDASYGTVSQEGLARIDHELNEADSFILLATHHTPLRLCASPSCQMKNADEFLTSIRKYPQIKGLVAGHTHNAVDELQAQLRIMTTPSTMVQVTHNQHEAFNNNEEFWDYHSADISRHGYRVIDLYANGSLTTEVHWVNAESHG